MAKPASANILHLYLLIVAFDLAWCHGDFGKNCDEKEKLEKIYGRTSDRDLFAALDITPSRSSKKSSTVKFNHQDFYDPSYGFSKESISSVGLSGKTRESSGEESISQPDILGHSGKGFQHHVYSKYPDLDSGYKTLLYQDSFQPSFKPEEKEAPSYLNPLSFLNSYVEKTKAEESIRGSGYDLSSPIKSSGGIDYEQFLKEHLKKQAEPPSHNFDFTKFLKDFKSEENSDAERFTLAPYKDQRPFHPYFGLEKDTNSDNKHLTDLFDQSKLVSDYFSKYAGNTDFEPSDDDDSNALKFPRKRRPNTGHRNRNSRRAPKGPAKCNGPRCRGKAPRVRITSL